MRRQTFAKTQYVTEKHKTTLESTVTQASMLFHLTKLLDFPSLVKTPIIVRKTTNTEETQAEGIVKDEPKKIPDVELFDIPAHNADEFLKLPPREGGEPPFPRDRLSHQ